MFGFWPLKMCTIDQFTHGTALRSPYLWKLTLNLKKLRCQKKSNTSWAIHT